MAAGYRYENGRHWRKGLPDDVTGMATDSGRGPKEVSLQVRRLWLMLFVIVWPSLVMAQEQTLTATVRDSFTADPVGDATVELYADGQLMETQVTGADGVVNFTVIVTTTETPTEYQESLGAAYPNPFVGSTHVPFSVKRGGRLEARVFDLLGRSVATLEQEIALGAHTLSVDLSGLAPGLYLVRLAQEGRSVGTARMIQTGMRAGHPELSLRAGSDHPLPAAKDGEAQGNSFELKISRDGYIEGKYFATAPDNLNVTAWLSVLPESVSFNGLIVYETGDTEVPVLVVNEDGTLLGVLGEEGKDDPIGAILTSAGDTSMVVMFRDDGLPDRAYVEDYIVLFDNYRDDLVDMAIINPEGNTTVIRDISLADVGGKRFYGKTDGFSLSRALNIVGTGMSVVACAVIIAHTAGAAVGIPQVAFSCGIAVLNVVLLVVPEDEVALRFSEAGLGAFASTLGCIDAATNPVNTLDCAQFTVGILEAIALLAEDYFADHADEIGEAENEINPPPTGETFTNSLGMEFIRIPAGTFQMGDIWGGGQSDESPVHTVTLTKDFFIGTYEVTQAQWEAVMGSNPSSFSSCGGDCPVETVSWYDVQAFIDALNAAEGTTAYRLPTEAEWEYAARAGTTTKYSFGNEENLLGDYAWYDVNSGSETHPVGQKQPNPWGLYDMHGNVWEWAQDWISNYSSSPTTDPAGPSSGTYRVVRGGGWVSGAFFLRSAFRLRAAPGFRYGILGFRLVRSAE